MQPQTNGEPNYRCVTRECLGFLFSHIRTQLCAGGNRKAARAVHAASVAFFLRGKSATLFSGCHLNPFTCVFRRLLVTHLGPDLWIFFPRFINFLCVSCNPLILLVFSVFPTLKIPLKWPVTLVKRNNPLSYSKDCLVKHITFQMSWI